MAAARKISITELQKALVEPLLPQGAMGTQAPQPSPSQCTLYTGASPAGGAFVPICTTGVAINTATVVFAPAVRLEDDYYGWLLDQASVLRHQRYNSVDWSNLAEELEAMAAKERREGKKQLKNLLAHLLKWSFQSEELPRRAHSWRRTIREAREELNDLFEDSPGLVTPLKNAFSQVYERARSKASDDTRLPLDQFPATSPWTLDEALAEEFWPEPATILSTNN